ncbi:uncharacterized protein LOC130781516 [Actinidia eriantha]|uniref:uncharacterized protein LOC130781516 n=1 Tax=Actinidia eriantha TaxID=165200 RepID=UPI002588A751|nr:uncharacterized protein LOC130781516 [Actinidia eriantha]
MRGEFKGLKTLILQENQNAYYVHCFAHQLQLALVAVAKKHYDVSWFFNLISNVLNVIGGSCKRHDALLEIQAAEVYKALNDFSTHECMVLEDQLDSYVYDMCHSSDFVGLRGLGELAQKLVQTKRRAVYPLIYRLLKLALILPVATASVERAFSALKIVKSCLRNRMGDQFLNDSLLVYIEKKRFNDISNNAIIDRFQKMKSRRGQL